VGCWNGDHDVHARHAKGAAAHPRSASEHLARARSEDRKGDRQRSQARDLFFGRLVLSAENESQQKKIIEIDARPSDCIAMATAQRAPIYVSLDVWDEVEDMTEALEAHGTAPGRQVIRSMEHGGRFKATRSCMDLLPVVTALAELGLRRRDFAVCETSLVCCPRLFECASYDSFGIWLSKRLMNGANRSSGTGRMVVV
jgi:hypothetical protein